MKKAANITDNIESVMTDELPKDRGNAPGEKRIGGRVLADGVIELPVITEIDYEAGLEKSRKLFGRFGCSAITKILEDGDVIIGRSFDLIYSDNPAYIIRTAAEGFYRTTGLAYNVFDGASFSEAAAEGIRRDELLTLLFFTVDIMNEKGLYIEANMRPEEPSSTGILPSTGTRPDAGSPIPFPALVRYLGERCATVGEALEKAYSLNVCGMDADSFFWSGAYLMADETGRHGVLELVDNRLIWTEGQDCHTNFFISAEYRRKSLFGEGLGRYNTLRKGIGDVQSEEDMARLIRSVRYSQLLEPGSSLFDPRSEFTGYEKSFADEGGMLTMKMSGEERYRNRIMNLIAQYAEKVRKSGKKNLMWMSVWQTTVSCTRRTLRVTFFEDDSRTFILRV